MERILSSFRNGMHEQSRKEGKIATPKTKGSSCTTRSILLLSYGQAVTHTVTAYEQGTSIA